MSDAIRNPAQEYWRPVQAPRTQLNAMAAEAVCSTCGTEYALGARFCHVCGAEREPQMGMGTSRTHAFFSQVGRVFNIENIRKTIGLSMASLVLFVVACACLLAAIMTGVIYSAATVLDWQAVQVWRVEWMLGAIAACVMGILLKKTMSE